MENENSVWMSDEQIEVLRQQISIYVTVSHQLLRMHKSISAQQALSGMRIKQQQQHPYSCCTNPLVRGCARGETRQRWSPTPAQREILENIYQHHNGTTPNKFGIKEITNHLIQHGPISQSNVSNWFQNRSARSKKKQKQQQQPQPQEHVQDVCLKEAEHMIKPQ